MNRKIKFSSALASAMVMILALPGGAAADGGPYGYGHYYGGPPHHAPYYPRYYSHYYPNYYPYYPCNNCGGNHHNNNNNNNDKLWIGLLGGGILGYGLNSYLRSNTAPQAYYPPPATVPQYAGSSPVNPCLQEREYRTKVMIGGKQVDGYGTACLQPDGSWRYGPAQTGP